MPPFATLSPSKGPATVIGYVLAGLYVLAGVIAAARDSFLPNMHPAVAAGVGLAIAVVVSAGRVWQAISGHVPVSWGVASTMALAAALLPALGVAFQEIGPAWVATGFDPDVLAAAGGVTASAFAFLRMVQSVSGASGAALDSFEESVVSLEDEIG